MSFKEKVITYKDRIVFIKLSMPFFNRTLKSYVEDEACFMFVNKGEVGVRTPDEYLKLNRNTAMIAKCLNYFFEPSKNKEVYKDGVESVGIFLYPSLVKDLFDLDISLSNHQNDYNVKQVQVDLMLDNFRQSIDILLENPELVDDGIIKTKLKEFVQLLIKSQNAPSQLDFLAALFKPNEVEFKKVIQQNAYANLTIKELALLTHLSESSFKRKFKEIFNNSPKKYLTEKKLKRAAELLKSSSDRISEIAYDVGFDSVSTFNRNFADFYGKSPSNYRLN
ncbi:helix-turn-helix domain-containing protein [Tenacibaculum holothuriorum]|uniref:helix-turn-helix domain-containing protein n=1 Tax=Tenacibaculum holothuriorum TaxID=1635173 RepID=UPI000A3221ED|nr:AraC family transcriptional regulator [Tenacibaculum holothuriorum]